jgi:hypothetical protein
VRTKDLFGLYLWLHWTDFFPENPTYTRFKCCKCECDRLVIKGTLLGKRIMCSAELRLPLKGFSLNFTPRNSRACAEDDENLVAIGQ